jgi:hypothetical protein
VDTSSERPIILFLHGRSQMEKSDDDIRVEWLRGFFSGQRAIGVPNLIPDRDLAFAFYKDFYRKPREPFSTYTCPEVIAPRNVPDPRAGICAPVARAQNVRGKRGLQFILLPLRDAFTHAQDALPTVAEFFFAHDTRDWRKRRGQYALTRRAVDDAIARARGRPLVIVAHSMGGLVMYDYLVRRTEAERGADRPRILRLITLGTQVGNPWYSDQLDTTRLRPHSYPHPAEGWMNLHDYEDPLGFALYDWDGEMLFQRDGKRHPPLDLGIGIASRYHHQIDAYLQHRYVARAITSAWCLGALRDPVTQSKPDVVAGCNHVDDVIAERSEPYRESGLKKAQHFIKYATWMGIGYWVGLSFDRGRQGEDQTWRIVGVATGALVPTIANAIRR